jgi:thiol-disulfide isomerase/thioredoxin
MPFSIVLLLALVLPQAAQSAPPKDALALLNEVSQRYADAKSYHIEAVEERSHNNDLSRHWDRTLLTAIVMPDGRYHFEGRSGFGSAILVSDGTRQSEYHPYDQLYTQQPASSNDPLLARVITSDVEPVRRAKTLIIELVHMADRMKSATYLPDETISVNGKSVACYVVHYADQPSQTGELSRVETLWIDKSRKLVVKSINRGETYTLTMARGHIPMAMETTVTYPTVELDQQEPASSFSFVAPTDAKLVTEFPNYFARNLQSVQPADLAGKPAPEIQFKSSDGATTALSSFHGKPVFIEFWATWCEPCVALMPDLTRLYAETQAQGLVWLSVDSDEDASVVAAFLSREHISWPNYHDEDEALGKAFHRTGIPLGVLVDADGKITFYKSGYGIADLRSAIAKLGPQFSSVAPASANAK